MIDPSSWRLYSQHPTLSKTGATLDRMTGATAETINVTTMITAETAKTVKEIVETIATTHVVKVTGEGNGVDRTSANGMRNSCKKN